MHELPRAGLEQESAVGAVTGSVLQRRVDCMESRPPRTQLRLFQSRHPREQRGGLRQLSRAGRSDGDDRAGRAAHHGLVPRLPPQSGQALEAARDDHRHDLAARRGPGADRPGAPPETRRSHPNQLHHLPPMKPRKYWKSIEERESSPEFLASLEREFPMGAAEMSDGMARWTLLQLSGAPLAASGLSGCPRAPPEKILPYNRQPLNLTPGNP